MAITANDIKLLASRVMDDIPNGGGAPTATVIQDGVSNAIFNDISEVDRAGGNVSMRKLFVGVLTPTTDIYLGANLIVSELPEDPNVSVTIFATNNVFDTRAEAASRVAAYLNAGPEWPGYLLEDHIAGQRVIQLFTRPGVAAPAVGRTLVLRLNEGLSNQVEQYVRVIRTSVEERTFTYASPSGPVDYPAQVITCDLSDALRTDFAGSPASRFFTIAAGKTKLRDTVVADAASYYSAARLADPASLGDIKVKVESIYSQLVPNAQTETAITDVRPSANYSVALASAPRAVNVGGSPFSQRIRVGQENRGYNYVTILQPLPAPGSVTISYRVLANTYTLTDDGLGNLVGAGSGRVNYQTGSVSVTLQALPDDRSAVVFSWGQVTAYTNRATNLTIRPPSVRLFHSMLMAAKYSTLSITWSSGGVTKTATADAKGIISGDATGRLLRSLQAVTLSGFSAMPDPSTEFVLSFQSEAQVAETIEGATPDAAGIVSFSTAGAIEPGTLSVEWYTSQTTSTTSGTTTSSSNAAKSSYGGATATETVRYTMPGIGMN
jgi:hypothetical protein